MIDSEMEGGRILPFRPAEVEDLVIVSTTISRLLKSMLFSMSYGMKRAHFQGYVYWHRRIRFSPLTHQDPHRSAKFERDVLEQGQGHRMTCTYQ